MIHGGMNNADLIVATLKAAGIDRGFGIPSGNVLPLMDAMRRGGVDFVLTAHEGSAGFAADVTGRITGTPGLCIATLGPGATNLATGVGCAFLDRSPMIAITCNLEHRAARPPHPDVDRPPRAVRPDHQGDRSACENGRIAETINEAVRIAMSEPRGPVHLDLPEDVALAPARETAAAPGVPSPLAKAADGAIAKAGELIARAQRPIAVLGSSAMRLARPGRLKEVIERHHLPFATTTMAKGLIDEDHPLSIGVIERSCRQVQRKLLRSRRPDRRARLRHHRGGVRGVDRRRAALAGRHRGGRHRALRQARASGDRRSRRLARGAAQLSPPAATPGPRPRSHAHRRAFQAALRPASNTFTAHAAIDAVRRALPRDGVLAFDVGAHTHQIASQWTAHAPLTFQITNGWSSMGFGLPAAIAAKLARPDLPVVCLVGDGCFQMTCGEVAVAKRVGLTLPFVVLDDSWLA